MATTEITKLTRSQHMTIRWARIQKIYYQDLPRLSFGCKIKHSIEAPEINIETAQVRRDIGVNEMRYANCTLVTGESTGLLSMQHHMLRNLIVYHITDMAIVNPLCKT